MPEKRIFTTREINLALARQLEVTRIVQLSGLKGQHCIAVGLPAGVTVQVAGTAGDFFGTLNNGASLTLNGNAGRFCGDSMLSGELVVNGDAGWGSGQYMRGGTLAVKGDSKGPVGQLMQAGTLIIDGSTGTEAGKYMAGGEIVVAGDTGERTGENMMRGVIFVRGEPRSLGLNTRLSPVSAEDLERLRFLHKQYRFRGLTSEDMLVDFRKITAESRRPLVGEVTK